MTTMNVKDAAGDVVAIEKPLAPGRVAAAAARPVALSDEDLAAIVAITTALTTLDGRVDGLESLLTTQAGYLDGLETALALLATETKAEAIRALLATQAGYLDGVEAAIAATNTKLDTAVTALQIIDDMVLAAGTNNIGDVDVATLPALVAGTASIGGTKDNGPHWESVFGVSGAAFTSADAQTPAAVTDAPTSGQKLVITDIIASSDTAMWLEFEIETAATIIFKVYVPANGTVQITPRGKCKLATADKKLMVDAGGAGNISVTAFYYSEA